MNQMWWPQIRCLSAHRNTFVELHVVNLMKLNHYTVKTLSLAVFQNDRHFFFRLLPSFYISIAEKGHSCVLPPFLMYSSIECEWRWKWNMKNKR